MPAIIGGSPWRVTEEIVKGFNPKSVFRERERERERVKRSPSLYDVRIKWHLLKIHLSLQICFWRRERGRLLFKKAKKAVSFVFETRSLVQNEPHRCTLGTGVY